GRRRDRRRGRVTVPETRPGELDDGLRRSRGGFMARLRGALGGSAISDATWDDVEEALIAGDVGATLASSVVERARRADTSDGAIAAVRRELQALLLPRDPAWRLAPPGVLPAVALFV